MEKKPILQEDDFDSPMMQNSWEMYLQSEDIRQLNYDLSSIYQALRMDREMYDTLDDNNDWPT